MATISTTYRAIDDFSPVMKKMADQLGKVTGCMDGLDRAITGLDTGGLEEVGDASKDTKEELSRLETQAKKTADAISSMERTKTALGVAGKAAKGLGSALNTVGNAGMAVTGALTGIGGMAAKTAVDFTRLYESSQIVFGQMLGSSDAAQKLYRDLYGIAKASTFSQESFLEAGRSLVGVGVSAEDTLKYLTAISDAVTGFGGDSESIERIAYAFRKVQTTGKIMMEDINMMADGGINAVKILANSYGVTVEEMRKMVSDGALPAQEALERLADGIENGTDGVNGMTQAMKGMSSAMKGKTLTGALDSMNSAVRNFSLNLLGLNPTLEETDERYGENQKRLRQLTAALNAVNDIISGSTPVFQGITDAVGGLLDKLVGANAVYDEASGKWQNVEGWLGKIKEYLETTDADKLREIGDHILTIAVRAPMLKAAGKALTGLGGAIEGLRGNWELLVKAFGKEPKAAFEAETPDLPATPPARGLEMPVKPVLEEPAARAPEVTKAAKAVEAAGSPRRIGSGAVPMADLWREDLMRQATEATGGVVDPKELERELFGDMTEDQQDEAMKAWLHDKVYSDPAAAARDEEKAWYNKELRKGYAQMAREKKAGKTHEEYDLMRMAGEAMEKMDPDKAMEAYSRYPGEWWRGVLEDMGAPSGMIDGIKAKSDEARGILDGMKVWEPETPETKEGADRRRRPQRTALFRPTDAGPLEQPAQNPASELKRTLDAAWSRSGDTSAVSGYFGKIRAAILGESKKTAAGAAGPIGRDVAGLKNVLGDAWGRAGDGGAVKRYFAAVSAEINPEGRRFKDQMAEAFAMAIPQGNTLGAMIKNSLGGLATAMKGAANTVGGVLTNLVPEPLLNSVAGKFAALKEMAATALGNLTGWFGEVGASIAAKVTGIFNAVSNWPIVTKLTGALSSLGSVAGPVISSVTGLAASIAGVASIGIVAVAGIGAVVGAFGLLNPEGETARKVTQFFDDFNQKVTGFKDRATEGINGFATQFVSRFPELVQRGSELIGSVVTGVLSAIPNLIVTGVEIVNNLITGFMTTLPELVAGGFTAIHNLIQGIKDGFPQFLESGKQMVISIKDSFEANLPIWIDKAKEAVVRFKDGLIQNVPFLLEAGLSMLQNLANFFKENFPAMVAWGTGMVLKIVEGLSTGIPWLLAQGWALIKGLAGAIWDHRQDIVNAAVDIGGALVQGLMDGVGALWSTLTEWLGAKWSEIVQNVRDFFGVHSPSTVFTEIGDNLIWGFLQGMAAKWQEVTQWITDSFNWVVDKVKGIFGGGNKADTGDIVDVNGLEAAKARIEELRGEIKAILDAIQSDFSAMGDTVIATINGKFAVAVVQAGGIVGNMAQTVKDGLSAIPPLFESAMGGAAQKAADAYGKMAKDVAARLEAMSSEVAAKLNGLSQTVQTSAEAMASGLTTAWRSGLDGAELETESFAANVAGKASATVSGVLAEFGKLEIGLPDAVNKASKPTLSAVGSLVEAVGKKADTLPVKLGQAASQMMSALKTTIENQITDVAGAVQKLTDAIKAKFEEGLGIHSPSDFMIWVGQMLLEGLIQGLSGSRLSDFVDNVIGDMKASFEGGKFNADELVNNLDEGAVMAIIGKVSGVDTSAVQQAATGIVYPLIGTMGLQTSWFGPRESPGGIGSTNHGGVDLAADAGTPIAAAIGGTVTTAGYSDGYGNLVTIDSGGLVTYYGHMSSVGTSVGAVVQAGQQIGLVGSTGNSTGPHLHFEMRQNGTQIDPQPYLEGAGLPAGVGAAQSPLAAAIQTALNKKKGLFGGAAGGLSVPYDPSGGAEQWRATVLQALGMLGQPASYADMVLYAIERESGGNPNAINLTDSNAASGNNSRGLLQTIPGTFQAYAFPGLAQNITDPLSNILAGLNYMIREYGGIAQVVVPRMNSSSGWYGYAKGTKSAAPGYHWVGEEGPELLRFRGGEEVIPNRESMRMASGGYDTGRIAGAAYPVFGPSQSGPVTLNIENTYNVANGSDAESVAALAERRMLRGLERAMARKGGVRSAY